MACARPDRIRSRERRTGAALKQFVVKTPAAWAGLSDKIRDRSGLPLLLIPAEMPWAEKPGPLSYRDSSLIVLAFDPVDSH
jgi:hypothetical protein